MLASLFTRCTRRVVGKTYCMTTSRFFSAESHDDFKAQSKIVPESMKDVLTMIDKQVKDNKVMLYMKGTPAAPQCGFSMQVCVVFYSFCSIDERRFLSSCLFF